MNKNFFLLTTEKVYKHLGDLESKKIYNDRVLYSMSNDMCYIRHMITTLYKKDSDIGKNGGIIFGAGIWGKIFLNTWNDSKWTAFVDNDTEKWGKCIEGLEVISPAELIDKYRENQIYIVTRIYNKEIQEQLINMGIDKKYIINIGSILDELSNKQYFDLKEIVHDKSEVFVDVGSFDGKTSLNFIKWCNNKYSHIWMFEADPINIKKIENNFDSEHTPNKTTIIPIGIWNEKTVLNFKSLGSGFSSISEKGERVVVDTLDNMLENQRVTFIKMDIEGAELPALKGAENIIRRQKPKLAISIYHHKEDIFDIPAVLLEYNSDYKFYLRHYSLAMYETVLYAV